MPFVDEHQDFNQLIERQGQLVYKLAYARCGNQADAEDIFQQVFLRYLTKKPVFVDAEHEKAWFIRVTLNRSKSLWSSAFRRHTQPLEDNLTAENAAPDFLSSREDLVDLAEALKRLPPDYRVLINLFYNEDLSTAEIAQMLEKREGTVRMQLTRARRQLQDILTGGEEIAAAVK